MITHKYVRSKTAPLTVKSYGYSDFTGQFDEADWEQVEGKPPEGFTEYVAPPSGLALAASEAMGMGIEDRKTYYIAQAAANIALQSGDPDAAEAIMVDAAITDSTTKGKIVAEYTKLKAK